MLGLRKLAILPAGIWALAGPAAMAETTLRLVAHSDLKVLDPIWTTAFITRNHGYMIYDVLFAQDEQLRIQPQMVDKYQVSATSSPGPSPCATAWNGTTASRSRRR